MATYNKLYESWIRGNNTIPATYGNVSLYTTGKSDLAGGITTTNLAIGKDISSNYVLDVSGNTYVGQTLTVFNGIKGRLVDSNMTNRVAPTTNGVTITGRLTNSSVLTYPPITGNEYIMQGYAESTYLTTNSTQYINAKKYFEILPETELDPSSNNQLVRKLYVDNAIAGSVPVGVAKLDVSNNFTQQNTFTGFCPQTNIDPSVNNDLTRKSWVDTQLLTKQATGNYTTTDTAQTISGAKTFSGITSFTGDISANSVLISPTELSYLNNVSSNIQTQLNSKQPTGAYAYDASCVHLTGNETINAQKTFYLDYSIPTLTNPFMRDFSNNGFAVPPFQAQTNMITQAGAYNLTYSGWNFVSGAGATTNLVQWWYGSGGVLEWTQDYCNGAPPPLQSSTFTGNYAIRFETYAPTQTFYVQNNCSLTAGLYVLSFYSFFGSSPYGGGYVGSTSASVAVSLNGNVSQVYRYSDPETRAQQRWKLHKFFFQVPTGQTATYIRWTPNEAQSATNLFRWALAGLSIVKYTGQQIQDSGALTTLGGSFGLLQNPYLNNPVALNTLSCLGTPQFSLLTGANNMVLNTAFSTNQSNSNNIGIGYGFSCPNQFRYTNNVIVGLQNGSINNTIDTTQIGVGIGNSYYRDTLIGNYLRSNTNVDGSGNLLYTLKNIYNEDVPTGSNVVIGSFIGRDTEPGRVPSTGVAMRSVAIGSAQYTRYNGYSKLPLQPEESVSIGYKALNQVWDNYNTAIGCYSLRRIDGNNNGDDGAGYFRITQFNTALGHSSGSTPRHANNCVFIGSFADISGNTTETTAFTNSTALGYGAKVRGNFSTAIGSNVVCEINNCVKIGRSNDLVQIDGSLNVLGNTTFTSLPTSNATPTTGSQLTTKTYVDTAISGSTPVGVAYLSANNAFTGKNSFSGITTFTGDISANNVLISPTELSYLDGVSSNIQTQLNGKQATGNYATTDTTETISGAKTFSGITTFTGDISANNVLISPTELSYLDGVSSSIQTQLNAKQATGNYAVLTDVSNTFLNENYFKGGLYAGHTQTIHFGSNAPTMSGWNIEANTIPDSALTTNIPKKDGNSNFSGHNQFSGIATFDGSFNLVCDISANGVLISPTEVSFLNDLSSNIQLQLNSKQATGNYAYRDVSNSFTQPNSFSQTITMTGGLSAISAQTITYGTNTITMGRCQTNSVRIGSSVQTITGAITFPNTNLNRKIVLYPVVNNEFQNYSIGVNDPSGETLFLVPDNTKSFKFGYATSTTAKQDVVKIDGSGVTLSVGTLTLPSASIADTALSSNIPLKNGTNTFSSLNTFSNGLTLSSGTLTLPSASISDSALSSNVMLSGKKSVLISTYTTTQTIQPPINTFKMDITIYSKGGLAGLSNGFGSYFVYGGSGAGGNMAIGTGINWNASKTLGLTIGSTEVSLSFSTLGTAVLKNGGNGGNGTSTGTPGTAGIANTTPNSLPTAIGNWMSYYGQNGQAGNATTSNYPYPPVPTIVGGGITNTIQSAGQYGGGQSYRTTDAYTLWSDSTYTGGGCIITWYCF